ncbi:homogentisate phytyltransferase [Chroococcidiopsis sp. FACHB-1243]|uniref:homogentisate phytyltransferase n=1 Tax=Chroococcidiopsis sp. [FACHB-1243] TaxID=2692781 RepID=UPI00177BD4AF|nr:homogentisate phytyltransferase [Chroococcidiopsis sp. [FACHB-1243]]MBD2306613.1 homogentisate phytyltransferase [Chroococcidiopsis sp. [FACHB-1243]]
MKRTVKTQRTPKVKRLNLAEWLYAFWKFSRPHTIIGTSLSVLGMYLIAFDAQIDLSPHPTFVRAGFADSSLIERIIQLSTPVRAGFADSSLIERIIHWLNPPLHPFLLAWIACLCGNIYIVGLNQLEDVEIDKINKPHLPIASGEFSRRTGQILIAITGILALVLAGTAGWYLFGMVAISLAIGTAYSLPPIRLKRFPFWAALCIFSVRGAIVNLGLFLHFNWLWQGILGIPSSVWTLTLFIVVFTFAIAIFKDIPDLEGDRQYHITTFTIALGKEKVFNLALWVIATCYVGIIIADIRGLPSVNSTFLISTHLLLLALLWWRSRQVNLQDKSAIASCYQFIWKLFFLEYLLFPVACLLGS